MSYLLDRKNKRKKVKRWIILLFALLLVFYFRAPVLSSVSSFLNFVFTPVVRTGDNIVSFLKDRRYLLKTKNNLQKENEELKRELSLFYVMDLNYEVVLKENKRIREILGRAKGEDFILAGVLSKPNKSPYDTLLVDAGSNSGIKEGGKVFALGDIPVGYVSEVFSNSSKVVLYSSPGNITLCTISETDAFVDLMGRGGGNFLVTLPRDFEIEEGVSFLLPGVNSQLVGIFDSIISDPRDTEKKVIVKSPVNIQEIEFVTIER